MDSGGKAHVLQKNNSITIIHNQYKALKEKRIGDQDVFVISET